MRGRWVAVVAGCAVLAATIAIAVTAGGSDRTPTTRPSRPVRPPPSSIASAPALPGSAYNAARNNILNPATKTGGTLRLLSNGDCDSWDPAQVTFRWCWSMQRLITRTLVGYANVNTRVRLGPDLATSLGRHNSDYTRWTYVLKPGLLFANGAPITPPDVKYGIERLPKDNVVRAAIDSITTTPDSITFRLTGPDAEFDYLMALPASAPVPVGKQPVASGPFEIRSYQRKRSVLFVRNPHWTQSSDSIRHPLVSEIRLTVVQHADSIDQQLQAGAADARADGGVQTAFRTQIMNNPRLKQNADEPLLPATRYVTVSPAVIPNVHCRRAIFYAWDKAASLRILGGPTTLTSAPSLTPPGIEGFDPALDVYPSGASGRGNVAKARAELRLCGRLHGFRTRMVNDLNTSTGRRLFAAERNALARVGITVGRFDIAPTGSFIFTGSPTQLKEFGIGVAPGIRVPDYPTAYSFYAPLVKDESPILPSGGISSIFSDPAVQHTVDGRPQTRTAWHRLNQEVMEYALFLPLTWERVLEYRNPRMTNVTVNLASGAGTYDFVNVGVR